MTTPASERTPLIPAVVSSIPYEVPPTAYTDSNTPYSPPNAPSSAYAALAASSRPKPPPPAHNHALRTLLGAVLIFLFVLALSLAWLFTRAHGGFSNTDDPLAAAREILDRVPVFVRFFVLLCSMFCVGSLYLVFFLSGLRFFLEGLLFSIWRVR